ncbi:HAD family hydrolase [Brevibacillus massiliensis]|jgi:phosphoglycolate phosphatase|uniref:HAD family hydrolase n=1 Tax=Brevibacillus massiliensis TaxID=1118054 RepID=UPI0003168D87|nr:HAD family hydrolase [Brevibacillus massiliensis]
MRSYQVILFDLDGTLSDPKIGITKSVQYALKKLGIDEPDLDKLEPFIGPPLQDSFPEWYGLDAEETDRAVRYYREYFKEKGMYENVLFPEIPGLLQELKRSGRQLVVATSKPTPFAEEILRYFQIDGYFDLVAGSNLDGTRLAKTEVIEYALDQYSDREKRDFVMIGDRKYDVIGANKTGIDSIAVTYGYGSREELLRENPTYLVSDIQGIREIILA